MKRLAVAVQQSRPLTRKRITSIPNRITGLYRLSVVSKIPFEVDIGGRVFHTARTLDVFHETPMFIDGVENAAALDFFSDGQSVRMIRLHPAGGDSKLTFRVTAKEEMQERHELERTLRLAHVETPLEYEGFLKHSFHGLQSATTTTYEEAAGAVPALDTIASAIAISLTVGAGLILVAPLIAPLALGALASSVPGAAATGIAVCDPSRTYINGRLFKNLKEVKVRVAAGRVVGYSYP